VSLRARVLLGFVFIAIVLIGAGFVVTRITEANLVAQVDRQLTNASGPRPNGVQLRSQLPPPSISEQPTLLSPLYMGIVTSSGSMQTLFEPNLGSEDASVPVIDVTAARAAAEQGEAYTTGSTPSGTRYRVRAALDTATGVVTVVALPLTDTDAAIARLVVVQAIATAIVLGVLALVAWWVVRLGVRPIKRMADAAAEIAGGDLSDRVPEGDPRTEAGELGVALNRMLEQIEAAFAERASTEARLRQFVADASHELRTPVTTIRGYAELYRDGALEDRADLDDAMRRAEQEAVRMGALVEDMLQLARIDEHRRLRGDPVDIASLASDAAADARAVDPARAITVIGDDHLFVKGDSDRLRQVLANLVGNALVHTPAGTPVELVTQRDVQAVVVDVVDHGPGMSPEIASHAFERFFRADPSRSRHRGGTGLGLSIVEAIVRAHGGDVVAVPTVGGGTTMRVRLPAVAAMSLPTR
jgi:two-component system OmpR family sensor kinase